MTSIHLSDGDLCSISNTPNTPSPTKHLWLPTNFHLFVFSIDYYYITIYIITLDISESISQIQRNPSLSKDISKALDYLGLS